VIRGRINNLESPAIMKKKKPASLSLDLDNKWSYLKTHGDPSWKSFPSYLDIVVPRILDFLDQHQLKTTFFVVGQDAALEENQAALAQLSAAGHEIGNHSFNHEPWLHLYTPEDLEQEFERSEMAIEQATGVRPRGFRGPGFSLSDEVLKTLIRRGYHYDASTFPTFLGPIARFYCFFKSHLSQEQKKDRKDLFGGWMDGFQSNKPFKWTFEKETLVEIPVTTMPFFKIPIHATYLQYLGGFSPRLARAYFSMALRLCRLAGVEPSFLLHPLDFLGEDDDRDLSFFPAMNQPAKTKMQLLHDCMDKFTASFEVLPMGSFVSRKQAPSKKRCVSHAVQGVGGEFAES
jgi:hypothetical protein